MRTQPKVTQRHAWRRMVAAALGLTLVSGCLVRAQDGLDLLLSPSASGNLSRLPYSSVASLAELLARLMP